MVLTRHNAGRVAQSLTIIEEMGVHLLGLLPYIDLLFQRLPAERLRRFLASWGACGQQSGQWGTDMTNVVYATAWCYLCQETGVPLRVRQVSGLNAAGNVIEMVLGLMFLAERLPGMSLETFRAQCRAWGFLWAADVWDETFDFVHSERFNLGELLGWRSTLEGFLRAWESLLRFDCPGTFGPWTTNRTWDPARILCAVDCLHMGWPATDRVLLEDFFQHPLPPPSALLPPQVLEAFWLHGRRRASALAR